MKHSQVLTMAALFASTVTPVFAQYPGEPSMPFGWKEDPVAYMRGTFERGAPHETVRQAQQILHDRGEYAGPIDGLLGPESRSAIWKFQKAHGLRLSGSLDRATVSALGLAQGGAYASPGASGPTNFGAR